jgi:hypothetical protein
MRTLKTLSGVALLALALTAVPVRATDPPNNDKGRTPTTGFYQGRVNIEDHDRAFDPHFLDAWFIAKQHLR